MNEKIHGFKIRAVIYLLWQNLDLRVPYLFMFWKLLITNQLDIIGNLYAMLYSQFFFQVMELFIIYYNMYYV